MGNSSGQKRMVINTRERAVSTDQNRSRDFSAALLVDTLHALFDPSGGGLVEGNGATILTGSAGPIGTPIEGAVIDGVMVVAPVGGTELSVTPGVVVLVDVDGLAGSPVVAAHSSDDSVAKIVVDSVGVTAGGGVLVLTANASGSTRIDLVEVRRNPNVILESDNRDLFDPNTGLFTATSVTKVQTARLEYRIRLGTPGAGLPAMAQGWMPIAVIGVPNGAVTFDTCAIYDVRPLVRDRAGMLTKASDQMPKTRLDAHVDGRTGAGERRLFGVLHTSFNGYRAGGRFAWEYAGARQDWINLQDAQFLEPGFASVANRPLHLWLAYPGGLPRWVRYTPNAIAPFGGRVPAGLYGVPVISTTQPSTQEGHAPASALSMPTGSGLTGATATQAHSAVALASSSSNARSLFMVRDNRLRFPNDALVAGSTPSISFAPVSSTATEDQYELVFGTHIPKNAKRVHVELQTRFTAAADTQFSFWYSAFAIDPLAVAWDYSVIEQLEPRHVGVRMPAAGEALPRFAVWLELPALTPQLAAYAAVDRHRVRVLWDQIGAAKDVAQSLIVILGWET